MYKCMLVFASRVQTLSCLFDYFIVICSGVFVVSFLVSFSLSGKIIERDSNLAFV